MIKNFQKNQKGMVLVAVLSIMTILFFLSTAFLWMMDVERKISVNHRDSTQSFYLAQAGLEHGTKAFYDDYLWREAGLTVTLDPGGSYTIICVDSSIPGAATLTSTGRAGNACRTLKTNLSNASFSMAYALLSNTNIGSDTATGTIAGDVHANVSVNLPNVSITGTVTQGDIVPVPKINMAAYKSSATLTYTGNKTFTCYDNDLISNDIVYVEADPDYPENPEAEPGLVTIHGVAGGPKGGHVRFDNCLIIAEGGFHLDGAKNIVMSRLVQGETEWPLLVTKAGNILEYDSAEFGARNFIGILASAEGDVVFNYIQLRGAISAGYIELKNNVSITNEGPWATEEPAGFLGLGTTSNWYEAY